MTPEECDRLTKEHSAEGLAAMVALVTAWRGGMDAADFGELVARTVRDIWTKPDCFARLTWIIGQLAAGQAELCEQWNDAAGAAPADEWLAVSARAAALDLAETGRT